MKQTLEKRFIVDICSIQEMIEINETEVHSVHPPHSLPLSAGGG